MKTIKKKLFENIIKVLFFSVIVTFGSCEHEYTYDDVLSEPLVNEPLDEVIVDTVTDDSERDKYERIVQINHKLATVQYEIGKLEMALDRVNLKAKEEISERIKELEETKEYLNSELKKAGESSETEVKEE